MATYRPSFVDVSGFTAGLSRGLEIDAQRKRQEDALAEQRVDDFMKMYQPNKLREIDIPEFTNAYNSYKQAALMYSRMNRSNAKPEQLALAKTNMDKALGGLNTIYSTSANASNKMAEYADAIKIARAKGLSIPQEMLQASSLLSSAPISRFKAEEIPSAYSFKLLSEDVDYQKVYKDMDILGAKATQQTQFLENPSAAYTFMGRPIRTREKITTETRNPATIAKALPSLLADPTHNGLKIQMDNQYEQFKNADQATKQEIANGLRQYFGDVTPDKVTPQMLIATRLASSGVVKREDDPNFVKMQVDEIKTGIGMSEKAKDRALRVQLDGDKIDINDYHPSVIIKAIVEQIGPNTRYNPATKSREYIATDLTNELKGYELRAPDGTNRGIDKVEYVAGGDNIQPYFRVRDVDGNEQVLQPKALTRAIVSAMGDLNFVKGAVSLDNIGYKGTTTPQSPSKKQDNDPLGIRK